MLELLSVLIGIWINIKCLHAEFKATLKKEFISWYASQVTAAGDDAPEPDLRLSAIKPLHAAWVLRAWEALKINQDAILKTSTAGSKLALSSCWSLCTKKNHLWTCDFSDFKCMSSSIIHKSLHCLTRNE